MSKQLNFTYEGKDYCLEYTRRSVETMEKNGFSVSDLQEKPMTVLPSLFAGAFLAHHRYVKQDVINAIFEKMTDRVELVGKLIEMYNEPISALINEPEEDTGNVNWTANW